MAKASVLTNAINVNDIDGFGEFGEEHINNIVEI